MRDEPATPAWRFAFAGDGNPDNDLYQCIVGTGGTTNWPPQNYSYNGSNAPYTPVNLGSVTGTYGYP